MAAQLTVFEGRAPTYTRAGEIANRKFTDFQADHSGAILSKVSLSQAHEHRRGETGDSEGVAIISIAVMWREPVE